MSDGGTRLTLESLRLENSDKYACYHCGIPKSREEFDGESLACIRCMMKIAPMMKLSDEELRKTKFDLSLEQLQSEQTPAIPGGVQRAHKILGGKTSSELSAEVILEIKTGMTIDGKESWLPKDGKLLQRSIETLQRAEIKHDEFLQSKPPETDISYEEAQSLSIDTIISEMTRNAQLRKRVLCILYERCPNLIDELMEVANMQVIDHPSDLIPDLESGGVI